MNKVMIGYVREGETYLVNGTGGTTREIVDYHVDVYTKTIDNPRQMMLSQIYFQDQENPYRAENLRVSVAAAKLLLSAVADASGNPYLDKIASGVDILSSANSAAEGDFMGGILNMGGLLPGLGIALDVPELLDSIVQYNSGYKPFTMVDGPSKLDNNFLMGDDYTDLTEWRLNRSDKDLSEIISRNENTACQNL